MSFDVSLVVRKFVDLSFSCIFFVYRQLCDNDDIDDDQDDADKILLCFSKACSTVMLGATRCRLQSAEFTQCSQRVSIHG